VIVPPHSVALPVTVGVTTAVIRQLPEPLLVMVKSGCVVGMLAQFIVSFSGGFTKVAKGGGVMVIF
jgi:hypothetical protein